MTAPKRSIKNPTKNPTTRPGLPAHLTPGNPGNRGGQKGRSGRKPLPFKEWCRDIVRDPKTQAAVREAAQDRSTPGFASVFKLLVSYDEGLPPQTIRIEGDAQVQMAFDVVKNVLRERLPADLAKSVILDIGQALKETLR